MQSRGKALPVFIFAISICMPILAQTSTGSVNKDQVPDSKGPQGRPSQAVPRSASEAPDQKAFQEAMRISDSGERAAALKKFLADYPQSSMLENAALQLAGAPRDPLDRRAALRKFIADYPNSSLKDRASYQAIGTIRDLQERMAAQWEFIRAYPASSYRSIVFRDWLDSCLGIKPVDEGKLSSQIDEYVSSIPGTSGSPGSPGAFRVEAFGVIAERLAGADILLDKAAGLLRKASTEISEKTPPLTRARQYTTLGRLQVKRKEYDAAIESLKKGIEAAGTRGYPDAYLALGELQEAQGKDDGALDSYLNAATFRMNAQTRSSLERVYQRKFGSLEGLHEKLDAVLLARPKLFDPGRFVRADTDQTGRAVLAELFTGSECGPCIAADMAFDGLIDRYDRQTVTILEYHLHIPRPDPMANVDSERRAKFYGIRGTPTAVFDGTDIHVGGGSAEASARNFDLYKRKVESRLSTVPPVTIAALRLVFEGDLLTASGVMRASAGGKFDPENVKLRIALVEEVVHYTGSNGIHFHRFVVRKLLGPKEGITVPMPGEEKTFRESANLKDLASEIREYLANYEREHADFKFVEKPDTAQAASFGVIAFVQKEETREILQSSFVRCGS